MRALNLAAALRVKGPDSLDFLQGQFSNDLGQMSVGGSVYGLWLNQKGKILADSFVLRLEEEAFLLLSHHGDSGRIFERLEAYIIMDDVELEVVAPPPRGLSVFADDPRVSSLGLEKPAAGAFTVSDSVFVFWGRGEKRKTLEAVCLDEGSLRGATLMNEASTRLEVESFQVDLWKAGVFEVGLDILDTDLPQEGGLEADGVSYRKGCYLGQEVMARIHAMGRVRRGMRCVSISGGGGFEANARVVDGAGAKKGVLRRTADCDGKLFGSAMLSVQVEGPLFANDLEGTARALELL